MTLEVYFGALKCGSKVLKRVYLEGFSKHTRVMAWSDPADPAEPDASWSKSDFENKLLELRNLLKPGGRIIFVTLPEHSPFFRLLPKYTYNPLAKTFSLWQLINKIKFPTDRLFISRKRMRFKISSNGNDNINIMDLKDIATYVSHANEGDEPIHAHCRKGDMESKYWLNRENFDLEQAFAYNMSPRDKRQIRKIIYEHFEYIEQQWDEFQRRRQQR